MIAVAWIVIAIFAPLIAPDGPARADVHAVAVGRRWHAPVRHRRARPRRLQPRDLRLAGLAADRAPARRARRDRSAASIGAVAGYFRGVARRRADAQRRPRVRVPADHPRDGGRGRARPRAAERRARDRRSSRGRRTRASCAGSCCSVGESEYVQSARLLGARARRALFRDVLPNVAGPVLVLMTLDLATAILLLSGLSFLGLGAQPPQAEWGSMVADGTQYFQWWWIGTFPGLAIFTVVLAFNFLGDSLRDIFDPRTGVGAPEETREPARGRGAARAAADAGGGCVTVVDGVDYAVEPGEVFGIAGESGSGKTISMLALLGLLPDGRRRRRERAASAAATCSASRAARSRELVRARARDGVPGSDDVAAPDADGRPAADRARPASPRPRPRAPPSSARSSCSSRCGSPTAEDGAARLPAPVLRRHAAADRDRDRARVPAEAADRRRADDGARRHRAGGDPAAARPPAPRERPRGDPDHARPRRDVVDRRPRLDLLRGAGRRVGPARRTCSSSRATRTRGRCSTRCRIPRRRRSSRSSRSPARRRRPGAIPRRLRVPPALRLRSRSRAGRDVPRARRRRRPRCSPVPSIPFGAA